MDGSLCQQLHGPSVCRAHQLRADGAPACLLQSKNALRLMRTGKGESDPRANVLRWLLIRESTTYLRGSKWSVRIHICVTWKRLGADHHEGASQRAELSVVRRRNLHENDATPNPLRRGGQPTRIHLGKPALPFLKTRKEQRRTSLFLQAHRPSQHADQVLDTPRHQHSATMLKHTPCSAPHNQASATKKTLYTSFKMSSWALRMLSS